MAVALLATTVKVVAGLVTEATPATNVTTAGLPLIILLPFTVAPIPTLPATRLVSVMIALPLPLVLTLVLPTIVPVPLSMLKITVWLETGLPLASTI